MVYRPLAIGSPDRVSDHTLNAAFGGLEKDARCRML
jgi:hypothetical protein